MPFPLTGEFAKPLNRAIEKLSAAVAAVYAPTHIRRVAKAEADSTLLKKETELQTDELQRRANQRVAIQEVYHQRNLENILTETAPLLDEYSKPENIDKDWMANFIDKAQGISDEEMQNLWARILAGKAKDPKTFSRRTINLLSDLEREEAEKFSILCRFLWSDSSGDRFPMIFNINENIYKDHDLDYDSVLHLESIGLVKIAQGSVFARVFKSDHTSIMYNHEQLVNIYPSNNESHLKIGRVILTKTGQELSKVCKSEPVEGYFDYISNHRELHITPEEAAMENPMM